MVPDITIQPNRRVQTLLERYQVMAFSLRDLPPELLTSILELAMESWLYEYPRSRATLSLVSRDFYSIIRNTPSLWTTIFGDYPLELNTLALTRSHAAPLEVIFDLSPVDDTKPAIASFKAAVHHLGRWRSATLVFGAKDGLLQLLARPAPLLEEVTISSSRIGNAVLSVDLFAGQADRLHTLRLMETAIPWRTSVLCGLQTLDLQQIPESALKLEDLMHSLASSPHLAHLTLRGLPFPHPPTDSDIIRLPHLQSLEIGDIGFTVIKHLLRCIQSPPCRCLIISVEVSDLNAAHEFLDLLHSFVPTTIPSEGTSSFNAGRDSLNYAFRPNGEFGIWVCITGGVSPLTPIPAFVSILPPGILAIPTHLYLHNSDYINHLGAALVALDRAHIIGLTTSYLGAGDDLILQ